MRLKCVVLCGAVLVSAVCTVKAVAQEYENILLRDIAAGIDTYKNKEITLRLRLKLVDNVFHAIVFYDAKNTDIEFDAEYYYKNDMLRPLLLDLHAGMEYCVSFRVTGVGALGNVYGELLRFVPVVLMKLPEVINSAAQ